MTTKYVGQNYHRKEDYNLLTGSCKFVGDMKIAGMVEATFIRSTHAHAKIVNIDTSEAEQLEGVTAVLTAKDIKNDLQELPPLSEFILPQILIDEINPVMKPCPEPILAENKVVYSGQPVVVILAKDRYIAEDAASLVDIKYEVLPTHTDPYKAMESEQPPVHEQIEGNVQSYFDVKTGNFNEASNKADHVIESTIKIPRTASSPIETRGVLANYESHSEQLTVWSSTQVPYMVRKYIHQLIGLTENNIRVIAPDVGGGFGLKAAVFTEEILISYLSIKYNRAVKWIEDRLENLTASRHGRDQIHDVTFAFNKDGSIVGLKDDFIVDCGAFNPLATTLSYNTAAHIRGVFNITNFEINAKNVLTNKTAVIPVRGAGRPEAVFAMDRIIDKISVYLGMDPAEVMFKNIIRPEEMPIDMGMYYRDGEKLVYDTGDYPSILQHSLDIVDYDNFRKEQEKSKKEGKYIGIGISSYIEGTGIGPHEGASARLDNSGQVVVHVGSSPHGQSHVTTFSQISADEFGITPEKVTVKASDTSLLQYGVGTFASRSAVVGGTAVQTASQKLREKIIAIAGEILEVDISELTMNSGHVFPSTNPNYFVTFQEIAKGAKPGTRKKGNKVPEGMEPGVEETYYFVPPTVTFSSGFNIAVVEVDKETGFVNIVRYVIVHDSGKALNPMIVEGQVQGGVSLGIGEALYEKVSYDNKTGQMLNGTYMDYLVPTSMEIPKVEMAEHEYLSTRNQSGIKGVGEAGAISPPAAITNAVIDALKPLKIDIDELPVTPSYLYQLINEAENKV